VVAPVVGLKKVGTGARPLANVKGSNVKYTRFRLDRP